MGTGAAFFVTSLVVDEPAEGSVAAGGVVLGADSAEIPGMDVGSCPSALTPHASGQKMRKNRFMCEIMAGANEKESAASAEDNCHEADILIPSRSTMKRLFIVAFAAIMLAPLVAMAENPPPNPSLCGPYPKNYKEIVWNWMQNVLVDADSAKIDWEGDPKPADLGKNGQHLCGWLVNFKVNSRNRFGTYTGKQSHSALIRDGQVIQGFGFGYR